MPRRRTTPRQGTLSWTWELFLLAERKPGLCPCCDRTLPPREAQKGRDRLLCGAAECNSLFQTIYRRGLRVPPPFGIALLLPAFAMIEPTAPPFAPEVSAYA